MPKANSLAAQIDNGQPILVPFLKWAGGKRWLAAQYGNLFPKSYKKYIEPFLGGGAIFFHLRPGNAILSDANENLIGVYQQLKENWCSVQKALQRHHRCHSPSYYYLERPRKHRAAHERAAQFIYLNRVCWNGLYRVNLRNEFNVPLGTKTAVVLDTDDFSAVSSLLRGASLAASDFEPIIDTAEQGDFLFIDPPYVTRHNFNGFAKYNQKIFCWTDQVRLSAAVRRAAKRGVLILLTNADHSSIRDLYADVGEKVTLRRHSVLAADARNRSATTEIAVTVNYWPVAL